MTCAAVGWPVAGDEWRGAGVADTSDAPDTRGCEEWDAEQERRRERRHAEVRENELYRRWRFARHEAGHAVVGVYCGVAAGPVGISDDGGAAVHALAGGLRSAVITAAGDLGEELNIPRPTGEPDMHITQLQRALERLSRGAVVDGVKLERYTAAVAADGRGEKLGEFVKLTAARLVRKLKGQIGMVARELYLHGALPGRRVEWIAGPMPRARRRMDRFLRNGK